jgi:hypothetical protein
VHTVSQTELLILITFDLNSSHMGLLSASPSLGGSPTDQSPMK